MPAALRLAHRGNEGVTLGDLLHDLRAVVPDLAFLALVDQMDDRHRVGHHRAAEFHDRLLLLRRQLLRGRLGRSRLGLGSSRGLRSGGAREREQHGAKKQTNRHWNDSGLGLELAKIPRPARRVCDIPLRRRGPANARERALLPRDASSVRGVDRVLASPELVVRAMRLRLAAWWRRADRSCIHDAVHGSAPN